MHRCDLARPHKVRTLRQFRAKAMPSRRRGHGSVLTCSQAAQIFPSKPPNISPFSSLRKKATGYHSACPVIGGMLPHDRWTECHAVLLIPLKGIVTV